MTVVLEEDHCAEIARYVECATGAARLLSSWFNDFDIRPALGPWRCGFNDADLCVVPHARGTGFQEPELHLELIRDLANAHGQWTARKGVTAHDEPCVLLWKQDKQQSEQHNDPCRLR